MKLWMYVFVGFCLCCNLAAAEEFRSKRDLRRFADTFMEHIVRSDFNAAFETAKAAWGVPQSTMDKVAQDLKKQLPKNMKRFGRSLNVEWIRQARIGESFLRHYYLQRFERDAVAWYIDFYRPDKDWLINRIGTLEDTDVLFE